LDRNLGRDLIALAGELVTLASQFDVVEHAEGCKLLAKRGILVLQILCSPARPEDRHAAPLGLIWGCRRHRRTRSRRSWWLLGGHRRTPLRWHRWRILDPELPAIRRRRP
jgi:hypothetical protein